VLFIEKSEENRIGVGWVTEPPRVLYGPIRQNGAGPDTSTPQELTEEQWEALGAWQKNWCRTSPPQVREPDTGNGDFYSIAMWCGNAGRKNFFVERKEIPQDIANILSTVTNKPEW
jgi:hypothetical protein